MTKGQETAIAAAIWVAFWCAVWGALFAASGSSAEPIPGGWFGAAVFTSCVILLGQSGLGWPDASISPPSPAEDSEPLNPRLAKRVYCSFCGKAEADVFYVVEGPANVGICDECVILASDVIQQQREACVRYAPYCFKRNV